MAILSSLIEKKRKEKKKVLTAITNELPLTTMGACWSSVQDETKATSGPLILPPSPPTPLKPEPKSNQLRQRQMQKRIAIAAEAIASASEISVPNIPKTQAARHLIERAISHNRNELFRGMSFAARQAIINSMKPMTVQSGEVIIRQGDADARTYYVVDRGAFEVRIDNLAVHTCTPGSGFGELALLYSSPRSATVTALEEGRLWVMDRAVYIAIKRSFAQEISRQTTELIEKVPMLAVLAPEHKAAVAEAFELVEYEDGVAICQQGEQGDAFFIIYEGSASVEIAGSSSPAVDRPQVVATLTKGMYFGERALLKNEPRTATVTAIGYVSCFKLSRAIFDQLLGPIQDVWRYEVLRKVAIFSNLTEKQLFDLAKCMSEETFAAGEIVFRHGEVGETFYVVQSGEFVVTDAEGQEIVKCTAGQCFGELALLRQAPRAATVTAINGTNSVLKCTKDVFDSHLGSYDDIRNLWRFEALSNVPLLKPLSQKQHLMLCKAFRVEEYTEGDAIVREGEDGDTFYIIERGECEVVRGSKTGVSTSAVESTHVYLKAGDYFGERALMQNEPRAASVIVHSPQVTVLCLGRLEFEALLGSLKDELNRHAQTYGNSEQASIVGEHQNIFDASCTNSLTIDVFKHVAELGAGAFGRVTLVEYKHGTLAQQQKAYFALKALSKAHVVQTGLAVHIKRERLLMSSFQSPFLVGLEASFQDDTTLYMVMEAVYGGEFFTYMQGLDRALSEGDARFYAGCVVLGLEYLHRQHSVAWRDLKPENLLLDSKNGYLKITDFGFAKKIPPTTRSYTLCGTPEYLAPELVAHSGHGMGVDWWALGVLVYEMVAGHPPFNHEDRIAMFRSIANVQYTMPEYFSPALKDLIRGLLIKVPSRRLGCGPGGVAAVKNHPWFRGFDWNALTERSMKAPYVPSVDVFSTLSVAADGSTGDSSTPSPSKSRDRYVSTGIFSDF